MNYVTFLFAVITPDSPVALSQTYTLPESEALDCDPNALCAADFPNAKFHYLGRFGQSDAEPHYAEFWTWTNEKMAEFRNREEEQE